MATRGSGSEKLPVEIRTKSVEHTLVPLVTQITTLVNAKEKPIKSQKTLAALSVVGQAVKQAVERFVIVGESIARENEDIGHDLNIACIEAREAGASIERLTAFTPRSTPGSSPDGGANVQNAAKVLAEKTSMVKAARQLLSAITKVLVLADRVVIKQLLAAKDKVILSLNKIEHVNNFTEFVKTFSQFGNEMVVLAHHTGERQNDLKSEKARAQMGAARAILEKSTMMLLTTSKAYLRHPECNSARLNRVGVVAQMRRSLEVIHLVVIDGTHPNDAVVASPSSANGDSGISLNQTQPNAIRDLKELEDLIEIAKMNLKNANTQDKIRCALEHVQEGAQDFTDSAYTPHAHREKILLVAERLQDDVGEKSSTNVSPDNEPPSPVLLAALAKAKEALQLLRKQLLETAIAQATEVFRSSSEEDILGAVKQAALCADALRVEELNRRLQEHTDQLLEVCKLLRHVASSDPLLVWTEHADDLLKFTSRQLIRSTLTLVSHGTSKIAKENVDVFVESYVAAVNDLSALVKELNDAGQGERVAERQVYLSLPRPGRHGKQERRAKAVTLNSQELNRIAKLGLEMRLMTSEMEAEAEKWEDPDNEIVRRAKNMSGMAFSLYLFTRGEGPLKNTSDLFQQAELFNEEGTRLFKVPQGTNKLELLQNLEKLPIGCQRLNYTLKSPTVGKSATFNKVDNVIHDTKALMNAVSKFSIDYRTRNATAVTSARWRDFHTNGGRDIESPRSTGSESESVRSVRSSRSDHAHAGLMRSSSLNRAMNGPSDVRFDRI